VKSKKAEITNYYT